MPQPCWLGSSGMGHQYLKHKHVDGVRNGSHVLMGGWVGELTYTMIVYF